MNLFDMCFLYSMEIKNEWMKMKLILLGLLPSTKVDQLKLPIISFAFISTYRCFVLLFAIFGIEWTRSHNFWSIPQFPALISTRFHRFRCIT